MKIRGWVVGEPPGTRQRWVIQLRGRISVSKGFVCLQTEQLSLAGTQLLQIGHVKPGGENGEEGQSQKKCVAFDAKLCLERLGNEVTPGDTPALAGVCGTERSNEGRFCSPAASGCYLTAPSTGS